MAASTSRASPAPSWRLSKPRSAAASKRTQGASTITQQVAKNFLLTNERSIERKIKEAILAIRIERAYSKDKILELYLNEIYLGINSYGVAAAGLTYFNKELKDLTIEEVAYLAALPKAPNNYHPFRPKQRATERRNWIIGQMAENGYITEGRGRGRQEEAAGRQSAPDRRAHFDGGILRRGSAAHAADAVRRRKALRRRHVGAHDARSASCSRSRASRLSTALCNSTASRAGAGRSRRSISPAIGACRSAPSKARPTFSPGASASCSRRRRPRRSSASSRQKQQDGTLVKEREAVEIALEEMKWAKVPVKKTTPTAASDVLAPGDVIYVAPKDPANLQGAWSLMQIPEVGGGLVAMDPHTGRVLAVAGGFSFAMSQFDRVIQAKRQPGSSFKPFVYAAAIDNGYKPTSIILDAPIEIEQGPGLDIWKPENYENQKIGWPVDAALRHREVAQPDDRAPGAGSRHADHHRIRQALRHLRRSAARAVHVARRRRDDAAAHGDGLLHAGQRRQASEGDADRPHSGPLGQNRLAA